MANLNFIYVPGVPQGSQQINNTQKPINNNFQDISQFVSVNHVGFNTANTFGNHTVVDFFGQSLDPSTADNEMALYSKPTNDTNGAQLFYRYPSNGTVVQLTSASTSDGTGDGTGSTTTSGGAMYNVAQLYGNQYFLDSSPSYDYIPPSQANIGYQYLTGGVLMVYGWYSFSWNGSATPLPFPLQPIPQIPAFTTEVFNLQVSQSFYNVNGPNGFYYNFLTSAVVTSLSQFTVNFSPQATSGALSFIAIGV